MGDYKDKTVTLEDFPFFSNTIKMASVHPCKHASVMKSLLDRADAALKIRREKQRRAKAVASEHGAGMEALVDEMGRADLGEKDKYKKAHQEGGKTAGNGNDEWEVLQHEGEGGPDDEVAIRVDQYLIVFLKFLSSLMPSIEHDFTMEV